MKCNAKLHQQINADARAFEAMLLYVLGELNEKEGYGKSRLQRVYDNTMLAMYRDAQFEKARLRLGAGDSYILFAMNNGLTAEAFQERQKDALVALEQELKEEIEKTWQARRAYLERKRNGQTK